MWAIWEWVSNCAPTAMQEKDLTVSLSQRSICHDIILELNSHTFKRRAHNIIISVIIIIKVNMPIQRLHPQNHRQKQTCHMFSFVGIACVCGFVCTHRRLPMPNTRTQIKIESSCSGGWDFRSLSLSCVRFCAACSAVSMHMPREPHKSDLQSRFAAALRCCNTVEK